MIRFGLWLLAGMLAVQLISFPASFDAFLLAIVALTLALPWLRRRDLVCLLAGALYFGWSAAAVLDSGLSSDLRGESMLVTVRIIDFPRSRSNATSFMASAVSDARIPERIRLSWFEPPVRLRLGDTWRLELRLQPPGGLANPGSGDAETRALRERLGATGYVAAGRHNILLDSGRLTGVERIRQDYLDRLKRQLPGNESAGVLAAIVVGARHLITDEQWDRYARTGTSHLMAISGLHVGLAAAGAFIALSAVMGLSGYRGNQYRWALAGALLSALAYAAVSGLAVPARRAALMLVIGTACIAWRRQPAPTRILAAAAVVTLLVDPLSSLAPGFKLSFMAVAWLIWFAKRQRPARPRWPLKPAADCVALAYIQIGLLMGLLPLTVVLFGRLSLVAPVLNFAAIPLFSIATVPLAMLSLVLDGPFAPLGDTAMRGAAASVEWVEALIALAASHRNASVPVAGISGIAWIYLMLPLAWLVLPRHWPARSAAWLALAVLPLWRPAGPPQGCFDLSMLDIGQGLSVIVRTSEHTLLYDSGPAYRNGGSAARHVVLPFLRHRGIRRIDTMLISHADLDHAGGAQFLHEGIEVGEILGGESLPWMPGPLAPCASHTNWEWDDVQFSIVHPDQAGVHSGNDASCVLLITAGDSKALLTGDIEAGVEAALVQKRVLPEVDVVSVPHHGSRTSSIAPFVQSLKPDYALVSAAAGNQWGFPKPDVVARWRSTGARVLTTANSGAVDFRICRSGSVSAPVEHRKHRRRVWHLVDS